MNTKVTVNCHEYSYTVERDDGSTLDFVSMPDEVTIGQNNPDGTHQDIVLTLQEAQSLQDLLVAVLVQ